MGSDLVGTVNGKGEFVFQSTLPAWGATNTIQEESIGFYISIHAPRMGSDHGHGEELLLGIDFNPRSPHGERQDAVALHAVFVKFQSTLPAWGAT